MSKQKASIPLVELEGYDRLIAGNPKIERKGKTTPYTSSNGYMFTFLSKEGDMGLRLPKNDRDEFITKFDTGLMEQYGRVMKEFVKVPKDLLSDTKSLSKYLEKSFEYVSNLKPK